MEVGKNWPLGQCLPLPGIPQHHARPKLWDSWGGKRQSLSVACGTLHLLISKSTQHRVEGERPCVILLSCFASTLSLSHVWVVAALGSRAGAPACRCLIEKKTRPRNIFQGICQQGPDMQFLGWVGGGFAYLEVFRVPLC